MTVIRQLRPLRAAVAVALAVAAVTATAATPAPAPSAEPTIRDLRGRPVEIRAGESVTRDDARTRALYRQLLELENGDPALRLEALRRLADLELEAGSEQLAEGVGAASTREAITLYGKLLEQSPDHPRAADVLYQLARAWEAEGEPGRALAYLDQLVARFPGSRHFDEAQFRRGEVLFSTQRWQEAVSAYSAVIAVEPPSLFRSQAFYKRGWSQYKLSDTEGSAASLLAMLDLKLVAADAPGRIVLPDTLPRAEREIVEDCMRALVLQFASLDGPASLERALAAHGPAPYDWLLYVELGNLMVGKERYQDGADAYRAFVVRSPSHERAPALLGMATDALRKGGFGTRVIESQREFVERFGAAGAAASAASPEVRAQLRTNLAELARYHHARAQASKQLADYREAARWYREYLAAFPADADAPETNYLLADSLFESAQYGEAAAEYERTAYQYPAGPRSATAAFASLVAFERHEATLQSAERDAWHRRSIDAALRFAAAFPADAQALPMQVRSVQQLFNLHDFDRAIAEATRLLDWTPPPADSQRRIAFNVMGDAQFELGHYPEAESAYVRLGALMSRDDPARSAIDERLAAAVYKQAEARQASGDGAGAVGDFLRVASVAPGASIRINAEYDAAALLIQRKEWPQAIEVLERIRAMFPGHALAAELPRKLALAYEEAGRPAEAAAEFVRISDSAAESLELRREALLHAADLYGQAQLPAREAQTLAVFVERYPTPMPPALEARQRLADLAASAGDEALRQRWLRDIVAAEKAGADARNDRTRTLAARATLALAAAPRDRFQAIALKAPLKSSLAAKRKALEQALAAYQSAAAYGVVEVTTLATFESAELYRRLAADLLASERPKGLDADALEQYTLLLEEQTFPFEEKAISLHEANAARAGAGVYDDGVRASF
nr:tetratricopeptide repeat protein [Steroidobacteraceae bacterium]